jgi:hypothetical protein
MSGHGTESGVDQTRHSMKLATFRKPNSFIDGSMGFNPHAQELETSQTQQNADIRIQRVRRSLSGLLNDGIEFALCAESAVDKMRSKSFISSVQGGSGKGSRKGEISESTVILDSESHLESDIPGAHPLRHEIPLPTASPSTSLRRSWGPYQLVALVPASKELCQFPLQHPRPQEEPVPVEAQRAHSLATPQGC